jgi:hypothetical protein
MSKFELKHHQSAAFASAVATGMIVAGPSGDGFLHLTFFRDILRCPVETFEAPDNVPGEHLHGEHLHGEHLHGEHLHGEHLHGVDVAQAVGQAETVLYREDVAIISIPAHLFPSFQEAISRHRLPQDQPAPNGPAGFSRLQ